MTDLHHQEMIQAARDNVNRLHGCKRHHFHPAPGGYKLGARLTCTECLGSMDIVAVGHYIRGYQAAGGAASDILDDWEEQSR